MASSKEQRQRRRPGRGTDLLRNSGRERGVDPVCNRRDVAECSWRGPDYDDDSIFPLTPDSRSIPLCDQYYLVHPAAMTEEDHWNMERERRLVLERQQETERARERERAPHDLLAAQRRVDAAMRDVSDAEGKLRQRRIERQREYERIQGREQSSRGLSDLQRRVHAAMWAVADAEEELRRRRSTLSVVAKEEEEVVKALEGVE